MRCMSLLRIESKKFPVSSSTQGALEFGGGVEPLLKISRRHLTRKEPIKNLPTRLRIHHSPPPAYVCLTLRVSGVPRECVRCTRLLGDSANQERSTRS